MKKQLGMVMCLTLAAGVPVFSQEFDRHAEIFGGDPDHGRCEVTVVVDGVARIEMRRAEARLIDERGAPATWRKFICSAPMPGDPREFAFRPLSGRGRQELLQRPDRGAPLVIRIEDPQGGAGEYRFEIVWRGFREGGFVPPPPPIVSRWGAEEAIQNCRDAVVRQARDRFRTDRIEVRRINVDDAEGRREWVVGTLEVRRDYDRIEPFRFSCSADWGGRRIRSVDIAPMDRDRR